MCPPNYLHQKLTKKQGCCLRPGPGGFFALFAGCSANNGWNCGVLVMSFIDEDLKHENPKLFLVRFMDNFAFLCGRKRTLHKAIRKLMEAAKDYGLRLKNDWQVFPVRARMLLFLSYRLNHEKTVLRKPLLYRMARRFIRAKNRMDAHTARTIMSYRGILKYCDSYHFKTSYLYPNVSICLCRRLISDADKKRAFRGTPRQSCSA